MIPIQSSAELSGRLALTSDYFYRGYSKSEGDPVVQANIDYEHSSGLFLGTSVSTVDFGDDDFKDSSRFEFIPYLGWTFNVSEDWRLDAQWTRYIFDGRIFNNRSDYNEFYLIANFRDLLTAAFSYADDAYNQDDFAYNGELDARYPVTDALQVSTGIGFYKALEVLDYDYLYWNFGFTWFYEFAALDFRYIHSVRTEEEDHDRNSWPFGPQTIDPKFLFTISVGF